MFTSVDNNLIIEPFSLWFYLAWYTHNKHCDIIIIHRCYLECAYGYQKKIDWRVYIPTLYLIAISVICHWYAPHFRFRIIYYYIRAVFPNRLRKLLSIYRITWVVLFATEPNCVQGFIASELCCVWGKSNN